MEFLAVTHRLVESFATTTTTTATAATTARSTGMTTATTVATTAAAAVTYTAYAGPAADNRSARGGTSAVVSHYPSVPTPHEPVVTVARDGGPPRGRLKFDRFRQSVAGKLRPTRPPAKALASTLEMVTEDDRVAYHAYTEDRLHQIRTLLWVPLVATTVVMLLFSIPIGGNVYGQTIWSNKLFAFVHWPLCIAFSIPPSAYTFKSITGHEILTSRAVLLRGSLVGACVPPIVFVLFQELGGIFPIPFTNVVVCLPVGHLTFLCLYFSLPSELRTNRLLQQTRLALDICTLVSLCAVLYMAHFYLTYNMGSGFRFTNISRGDLPPWQDFFLPWLRPLLRDSCKFAILKRLDVAKDIVHDVGKARSLMMYPDYFHAVFTAVLVVASRSDMVLVSVALTDLTTIWSYLVLLHAQGTQASCRPPADCFSRCPCGWSDARRPNARVDCVRNCDAHGGGADSSSSSSSSSSLSSSLSPSSSSATATACNNHGCCDEPCRRQGAIDAAPTPSKLVTVSPHARHCDAPSPSSAALPAASAARWGRRSRSRVVPLQLLERRAIPDAGPTNDGRRNNGACESESESLGPISMELASGGSKTGSKSRSDAASTLSTASLSDMESTTSDGDTGSKTNGDVKRQRRGKVVHGMPTIAGLQKRRREASAFSHLSQGHFRDRKVLFNCQQLVSLQYPNLTAPIQCGSLVATIALSNFDGFEQIGNGRFGPIARCSAILWGLEFSFFVSAHWFIARNFGADLLKLCAFHVDRDGWSMVAMQIGCLCVLFGCFAHLNGMDVSFQFSWLHTTSQDADDSGDAAAVAATSA